MEERSRIVLAVLVYGAAFVALCRLVGASVARKRFSIRNALYASAIVAVMVAILAAKFWAK